MAPLDNDRIIALAHAVESLYAAFVKVLIAYFRVALLNIAVDFFHSTQYNVWEQW